MKLIALCLCLFACGTAEEEIAEPTPAAPVSSMRSVQTAVKPTTPAPEQPPTKKAVRKRLELSVGSDWITRGTGTYSGGTLASLPTLPSCLEYASAFGGGMPAAEYSFSLSARLEQVVQLPPEALAADDLSVVPMVQYTHTVGLPAKFTGADNLHCTEQAAAISEFRFETMGAQWQPTYTEYAGSSSNPPKGATALRLRLRLHGQSSITPVSVKVLVLYTVWE